MFTIQKPLVYWSWSVPYHRSNTGGGDGPASDLPTHHARDVPLDRLYKPSSNSSITISKKSKHYHSQLHYHRIRCNICTIFSSDVIV